MERVSLEGRLPRLAGTPRQVEWAEALRGRMLADAAAYVKEMEATLGAMSGGAQEGSELRALLADKLYALHGALALMRVEPTAAWWIGKRDAHVGELLTTWVSRMALREETAGAER
jgi:hypothetical protein